MEFFIVLSVLPETVEKFKVVLSTIVNGCLYHTVNLYHLFPSLTTILNGTLNSLKVGEL